MFEYKKLKKSKAYRDKSKITFDEIEIAKEFKVVSNGFEKKILKRMKSTIRMKNRATLNLKRKKKKKTIEFK